MSLNVAALRHQLLSMRAAIDAALAILTEDEQLQGPQECQHPEEARIDIAVMGHPDAWQCGVCGYVHQGGDD